MSYRVIIQPRAFDDLDEAYEYLSTRYSGSDTVSAVVREKRWERGEKSGTLLIRPASRLESPHGDCRHS